LFLAEYEATTQDALFGEGETSLGFLELNLNKVYHQLAQFYQLKDTWKEYRNELEKTSQSLLSQPIRPITDERYMRFRTNIDKLRHRYVDFSVWATHLAELQQTLQLNRDNYYDTANRLNLLTQEDLIFDTNLRRIQQGLRQLTANIRYDEIALQRLTLGLQTIQTDLDFSLIEAQQREEKREAYNDRLLALLGILLALSAFYPFIRDIMTYWPFCSQYSWSCSPVWRWGGTLVLFLAFMAAFWGLYAWWQKNRPAD